MKSTSTPTTSRRSKPLDLLAIAAIASIVGCQDEATPASTQFRDSPRSEAHEQLVAEASRCTALTDEIALLQQAGWTGGDFAQTRSLRTEDGQIAVALAFARTVDHATLDLIYAPDGDGGDYRGFGRPHVPDSDGGGFRGFVRPHGAASAAALSRSLASLNEGRDRGASASVFTCGNP
jgi:hypothetical protein